MMLPEPDPLTTTPLIPPPIGLTAVVVDVLTVPSLLTASSAAFFWAVRVTSLA